MRARRLAALALVLGAFAAAIAKDPTPALGASATGRADVHLVSLLEEVPDSLRARIGPVHDVRLRLLKGNVLLLKHKGDFIALLPIERISGREDSLQYFYFRERAPIFWVIPGSREKGVRTVADGGEIRLEAPRLLWRSGPGAGWIYFPEVTENAGLKFSVVSGSSVDQADPAETKYWVELGTPGTSGF
jgi:hypothetical protein